MASAAALLQAVISCLTILTVNQIVRKVDADSAMI
jgi:ABC-type polysaccharide transport system permease subunit